MTAGASVRISDGPRFQGQSYGLGFENDQVWVSTPSAGSRCALSGSKMVEMLASTRPLAVHVALALANGTSGLTMVNGPLTHLPAPRH